MSFPEASKQQSDSNGSSNRFQCDQCGRTYQSKASLRIHTKKSHSSQPQYPCRYISCNEVFRTLELRKTHEKTLHDISLKRTNAHFVDVANDENGGKLCKLRACRVANCSCIFTKPKDLQNHEIEVHNFVFNKPLQPLESLETGSGIPSSSNRESTSQSAPVRFVCDQCGRTYGTKTNLRVHVKQVHSTEAKYPCRFISCDSTFQSLYLRKQHEKAEHKIFVKPRDALLVVPQCGIHGDITKRVRACRLVNCNCTFTSTKELERHEREVHNFLYKKQQESTASAQDENQCSSSIGQGIPDAQAEIVSSSNQRNTTDLDEEDDLGDVDLMEVEDMLKIMSTE